MFPLKTSLAIATFGALILVPRVVPALAKFASLNLHDIPLIWDLPVPKPAGFDEDNSTDEMRAKRLAKRAPQNLLDPSSELDPFYAALLKGGTVRILHYGDSPTTGDLITADTRAMLQKDFGDAGTGFVLIAKPWAWYFHRGVDMDSSHWTIDVAGSTEIKDGLHGLGGASFQGNVGAEATFKIKDSQHRVAEVGFLAQPNGGTFSFQADGMEIGTANTAAEERHADWILFNLPEGTKKFTIRVTSGTVRLYGVEFRKQKPGVIYSSLGINGAAVTVLSHAFNGAHWATELKHYKPNLVVLAYGTNESGYAKFVDNVWGDELKVAVKRVRDALPESSVLLMSPMDRGVDSSGEIKTIDTLPRMIKIEEKVAEESNVAFFNTFQAMGGSGTMARWYKSEPRLVGSDYIHPMPAGAKIVGELLYTALRDGYNAYKLRQLKEREK